MSPAHAFVADLETPALDDDDRRHLERVLRLRDGERITVSDGRGGQRACRFRTGGELDVEGTVERTAAPAPTVTVALALPKGDRPEWAVQKLTEVGVDRIALLHTARSVVQWSDDERAQRHVDRLRRVARQAAMQSRRLWLPAIEGPVPFESAASWPGACMAERDGGPPTLGAPVVLVGPEGGWSDAERSVGLPTVSLGAHVLRAETAAVAAGVLLCALRWTLVLPSG